MCDYSGVWQTFTDKPGAPSAPGSPYREDTEHVYYNIFNILIYYNVYYNI